MFKFLLPRARRLVVTLAIIGLLIGGLTAFFTLRQERFTAQATLAMLPGPEVPPQEALAFWEVLNRGQATRTAALTLEDGRWVTLMSEATNVPASDFTLSAGAIPDTTLIEVSVQANSAWAAERGLGTVLADGVAFAARVSGPFIIETGSVEYEQASSLSPGLVQQIGAFALAGLLLGAGAGFLMSRSGKAGRARSEQQQQQNPRQLPQQAQQQQPSTKVSSTRSEPSDVEPVQQPGSPPKRAR